MTPPEFISFVIYVLTLVTMTYGITESVLLQVPRMLIAVHGSVGTRHWGEWLVYCAICSSFWCGAVAGLVAFDGQAWPMRLLVGALLAPGFVILMRVPVPDFLPGAQSEREHVQRIRRELGTEADESTTDRPGGAGVEADPGDPDDDSDVNE